MKASPQLVRRALPLHYHLKLWGFKTPIIVASAYVLSGILALFAGYVGLSSAWRIDPIISHASGRSLSCVCMASFSLKCGASIFLTGPSLLMLDLASSVELQSFSLPLHYCWTNFIILFLIWFPFEFFVYPAALAIHLLSNLMIIVCLDFACLAEDWYERSCTLHKLDGRIITGR